MTNCPVCQALLFGGKTILGYEHHCPPKWLVWEEDEDRCEAVTVYASSAEMAAADWAQDTAPDRDYCIEETVLCVANADEPEESGFVRIVVYGEHSIEWRAYTAVDQSPDTRGPGGNDE